MRLDRFLTLYFFNPLAKPPKNGIRMPILMYHSICDERETGHPYYWINTSPDLFANHMKFLHDNGYEVITLSAAVDLMAPNAQPGTQNSLCSSFRNPWTRNVSISPYTLHPVPRKVVLTFDDGYRDFYTHAFPVLQKYDFTATVFLPTDYIGNCRPGLRGKRHLSWEEVRELAGQGITIGSHTCSHPQLRDVAHGALEDELGRSRSAIEKEVGPCDGFCYPYKFPEQEGQFISVLAQGLLAAGYHYCVSTRIGTVNKADDIFALKRIPVNSADDLGLFSAKLQGGYDWVAKLQRLLKKARQVARGRELSKSGLVTHNS